MVLLSQNVGKSLIGVIQSAILGSILANLLFCLGLCFFVGGMKRDKQQFDSIISEVGNGLLLTAGFGLTIPCAFSLAVGETVEPAELDALVLQISRSTSVVLLIAFVMWVHLLLPLLIVDLCISPGLAIFGLWENLLTYF